MNISSIQNSEIDALARSLLRNIQDYFADEENQKKFEEWKKARERPMQLMQKG